MREEIKIQRFWSMPNPWTFKITPVAILLSDYVGNGRGWIDPFAGENSPAEFTNDLNPARPAKEHKDALEFCKDLPGEEYEGVLFDPPYSLTQLKKCYEGFGMAMSQDNAQRFPQNVKEIIAPKIKKGGKAITFGWNSQGFGKNLGFHLDEVLLVAHGRSHNDTIVTVETKL